MQFVAVYSALKGSGGFHLIGKGTAMATKSHLRPLLKHARETIDVCLPGDQSGSQLSCDGLDSKVKEVLFALSAAGVANPRAELTAEEKEDFWHIIVKLWVKQGNKPWIVRPIQCAVDNRLWTVSDPNAIGWRPAMAFLLINDASGMPHNAVSLQNWCADVQTSTTEVPQWMVAIRQQTR